MRIFLDAGHGGTNPGAIGVNGLKESEVTLDVALRCGRILQSQGYTVNYSRTSEVIVSLAERARLANQWGADYFVSIHCNSNTNPIYKGTESFFYRAGSVAEDFALVVNTALVDAINTRDLGVFSANFAVLRLTRMPAILVELAFLSNPEEAELLSQSTFRQRCAEGIARGIVDFTS